MNETIQPVINGLNAPFWEAAADGRLVLPFCVATDRYFWPPSPLSPFPGGKAMEWREAEPAGTLQTQVVYRRAFQQAFAALMPYGVALVALDAGPRLLVHVADPDAPDAPKTSDRVTLGFVRLFDGGPPVPAISAAR